MQPNHIPAPELLRVGPPGPRVRKYIGDSALALPIARIANELRDEMLEAYQNANDEHEMVAFGQSIRFIKRWGGVNLKDIWMDAQARDYKKEFDALEKEFCNLLLAEVKKQIEISQEHLESPDLMRMMMNSQFEKDMSIYYRSEELAVEYLAKYEVKVRELIQLFHPKVVGEISPTPLRTFTGLRGVVTDTLGNQHKLVCGKVAAQMISLGKVPELPFIETYAMQRELERLGLVVDVKPTSKERGSRFCNADDVQYVVYHKDRTDTGFRVATFWDKGAITACSKELGGFGDKEGDVILGVPLEVAMREMRPTFALNEDDVLYSAQVEVRKIGAIGVFSTDSHDFYAKADFADDELLNALFDTLRSRDLEPRVAFLIKAASELRVEALPQLATMAGPAYAFGRNAMAAMGEAGGNASAVDWRKVEQATIDECIVQYGQSPERVLDALLKISPGADSRKRVFELDALVSEAARQASLALRTPPLDHAP
jgi:hypothetical protein